MEGDDTPEREEHPPEKPPRKMPKRKRQFCRSNEKRGAPDSKRSRAQGQDTSGDGTAATAPVVPPLDAPPPSNPIRRSVTSQAVSRNHTISELEAELKRACSENKSLTADLSAATKKLNSADKKNGALKESVPPKSHNNTKIMIGDPQNIFGMCDGSVFWAIGGGFVQIFIQQ